MAKPYHKNPRQITAKQYEALAVDLAELGDLGGIVHDLNSDELIGGNQRGRVFDINACDVVLTEVLPEPDAQGTVAHGYVIWKGAKYAYRQVRWTPRQCERANIVANKRGGTWDFDILADRFEQDDLLAWGFEPFELGLGEDEPKPPGDTEPQTDRAEELRQLWNVQPGQLWQLGEHRLIVGDCTDAATVARVMGGERADFVFGDPPYEMEPNAQAAIIDSFGVPTLWFGSIPPLVNVLRCTSRRVVYDFAWLTGGRALLPNRNFIIPMHKNIVLFAEKLPELIFDGASHIGKGKLPSVLEVEYDFEKQHKHEKPLSMIMALLASYKFDTVFDPFCGSGTTIIACANLKRRCFACELSAEYTAVCLQRYIDHTGVKPELRA